MLFWLFKAFYFSQKGYIRVKKCFSGFVRRNFFVIYFFMNERSYMFWHNVQYSNYENGLEFCLPCGIRGEVCKLICMEVWSWYLDNTWLDDTPGLVDIRLLEPSRHPILSLKKCEKYNILSIKYINWILTFYLWCIIRT